MSQAWTIIDRATGVVAYASFLTEGEHPLAAGCGLDPDTHEFIPIEEAPRAGLDAWTGEAWAPDLEAEKALKWEAVKAQRAAREFSETIPTSWGLVQGNKDSKQRIAGAVQSAAIFKMLGQPRTYTWTLADNSEPTLDVDQMIQFGLEVMGYVDACYNYARALRAAIRSAGSVEDLAAIDVEAGWPGE